MHPARHPLKLWIAAAVFFAATGLLAYGFRDAVRDASPGGTGVESTRDITALIQKIRTQSRADDKVKELLGFMWESVRRFDFRELYDSRFLSSMPDGYRGFYFTGTNLPESYDFHVTGPEEFGREIQEFGSFNARFGLKKNPDSLVGGRSFSTNLELVAQSGELALDYSLFFADGLLRVLSPDNVRDLSSAIPGGDGARGLSAAFAMDFPELRRVLDPYVYVRTVLDRESRGGEAYSRFSVAVGVREEALARDYPLASAYLNRLRDLAEVQGTVTTTQGQVIASFALRTQQDMLVVSFLTRDGMIVPRTSEGAPVFSEAFSPGNVEDLPFRVALDMVNQAKGLVFSTEDFIVRAQLVRKKTGGNLVFRLGDVHKTQVTGRAYNIVPAWLVNLMIPSDMEQLVDDFHRVAASANNGEGSFMSFYWADGGRDRKLAFEAKSEIVDNFFIRFLFGALRENFETDPPTAREIHGLFTKALDALLSDLGKMKGEG